VNSTVAGRTEGAGHASRTGLGVPGHGAAAETVSAVSLYGKRAGLQLTHASTHIQE
jgi:hypothetical protein